ncbi:hypothetical protein QE422_000433 [Chryseobacterium sp. SORGH_AS 447]|nr:hypothetical protein [Chryseobacterium sp. SORGH_AS_0447]
MEKENGNCDRELKINQKQIRNKNFYKEELDMPRLYT